MDLVRAGIVSYWRVITVISLIFASTIDLYAQEEIGMDQMVIPLAGAATLPQHLNHIDKQIAESLSYSSSRFDIGDLVTVDDQLLSLRDYLDVIFDGYDKVYLVRGSKILIVIQGETEASDRHIYGYIRDVETGEVLGRALVQAEKSGRETYTNNVGYYNLRISGSREKITASYFGYKTKAVSITSNSDLQQDISLESSTQLETVLISGSQPTPQRGSTDGSIRLDLDRLAAYGSLTGEDDLLNAVKVNAAVQSGAEGQGGYYVRGGSPDQNLILLDGVAMYEVSHTAGISSIFNTNSIREATLVTEGFDARYGGRMSSVMDIHLKDGHYKDVLGSVDVGLFGAGIHLEGPLSEGKTAFNISGKTSWVNAYIDAVIPEETQYDDIDVGYEDITVKLSHRFSPVSRLSLTMYQGNDELELLSEERVEEDAFNGFRYSENNLLRWGSEVYAANYEQILGDKWLMRAHLGYIDYSYESSSAYDFGATVEGQSSSRQLDVVSQSGIRDWSVGLLAEHYVSSIHKLTVGGGIILHNNEPTLKSTNASSNVTTTIIQDSSRQYLTNEYSVHLDDNVLLKPWLRLRTGLRFSLYDTEDQDYAYLEPRLTLHAYPAAGHTITLAGSRMTQNVHLLVNPGIGLPSDLWVPSTGNIAPEISDQLTLSYDYQYNTSWLFKLSVYSKYQQNLLEYSNPIDLFFTILNNDNVAPVQVQNRQWEDRVSVGNGRSRGLEASLQRISGRYTGWMTYSWSRTERRFDDIDEGAYFPYRYDRTHDVNLGCRIVLSQYFDIGVSYIYGTGNAITLALEEIPTPTGPVLIAGERNAFRMQDYHRMDIKIRYQKEYADDSKLTIGLGAYNVSNRLNPYYIYLFEDRLTENRELRQVSLFPFLPTFRLSYSFG